MQVSAGAVLCDVTINRQIDKHDNDSGRKGGYVDAVGNLWIEVKYDHGELVSLFVRLTVFFIVHSLIEGVS